MSDEAITDQAPPARPPSSDGAITDQAPPAARSEAITDQPPAPLPAFAPVTPAERLANLDFARGLALLGILFVNIATFFGPIASLMAPTVYAQYSGADRVAALLVLSLFTGKFISIFSLLFGYGLFGQIERAAERGGAPVWFTLRRLAALAFFGLAHALLLWYGDILFVYALIGVWMLVARYLSVRWLIAVAVVLLLIAVALRGGLTLIGASSPPPPPPPPAAPVEAPPRGFEAIWEARFNPASPTWVEAETAAYRDGPLGDAFAFRLVSWLFVLVFSAILAGWQILGMFFLGAALYRLRFFDPDRAWLRRRVLMICLPLGAAFEGAAAYVYWTYPPGDLRAWGLAGVAQQAGLLFLPLGYLALFALVADALPALARAPVCNAGRMSLTVYLGETVIATALSYWWGLRLFGKVGPAEQVGLAVLIWLVLAVFSTVWLAFFSQGPMEWLWRRLAYSRSSARAAA
jgi:uncharacterized protein